MPASAVDDRQEDVPRGDDISCGKSINQIIYFYTAQALELYSDKWLSPRCLTIFDPIVSTQSDQVPSSLYWNFRLEIILECGVVG